MMESIQFLSFCLFVPQKLIRQVVSHPPVNFIFDFHLKYFLFFFDWFQVSSYLDGVWNSWPHNLIKVIIQSLKVILNSFTMPFVFNIVKFDSLLLSYFDTDFALNNYVESISELTLIKNNMVFLNSLYF